VRVRRVSLFVDGGGSLDVASIWCLPRMRCGLLDTVCDRRGRISVSTIVCAARRETRRSGFQKERPTALFGELVPEQLVVRPCNSYALFSVVRQRLDIGGR